MQLAVLGTVTAMYLLCLDEEAVLTRAERKLIELFRRTDERGRATILTVARGDGRKTS